MNEQEKTLKALSLTAAELHVQNIMNVITSGGIMLDYSLTDEELIQKLADHFLACFNGDSLSLMNILRPVVNAIGR
jgi:hypothetical protein